MGAHSGSKNESLTARFSGAATAGLLELLGFHPIDTVAKRLMNNKQKVFVTGQSLSSNMSNVKSVIFRDAASKGFSFQFPDLIGYKIMQRVYKFGGQPIVNDYLNKNHKPAFESLFGSNAKTIMYATAGSLIGIGEIILLPLDILKIKMQTNPQALQGRGLFKIIGEEGFALYKGWTWTAARNAPGSFALFGGSAFAKEYIFGLTDYSKATFFQNFIASIAGAVASIVISSPMDVVKTRIQAAKFESKESGIEIVSKMIKQEGPMSIFKGLTPKILVVGPKLIFSFTVAQQLIPIIDKYLSGK